MGSDVTIRQPLFQEDWRELEALIYAHPDELNRTPHELVKLATDVLDSPFIESWIAYTPRNGVVGFVALDLGRKKSDRHTASLRILLAPEGRGKGIGGMLISRALDWADENQIRRVTATPYMRGGRLGFFVRHGFTREGVLRSAAKVDGKLVDVALLARVA